MFLDDGETSFMRAVAKRRYAAHPHAFGFRCGNLVADSLCGDLSLELGKGEKHVEREPAHARRCIERLRDRNEARARFVEGFDQLGKVQQ